MPSEVIFVFFSADPTEDITVPQYSFSSGDQGAESFVPGGMAHGVIDGLELGQCPTRGGRSLVAASTGKDEDFIYLVMLGWVALLDTKNAVGTAADEGTELGQDARCEQAHGLNSEK